MNLRWGLDHRREGSVNALVGQTVIISWRTIILDLKLRVAFSSSIFEKASNPSDLDSMT